MTRAKTYAWLTKCELGKACYTGWNFRKGLRIYAIKRPRRLFETWPGRPGVCLKPAFNRVPAFINEAQFSIFCSGLFITPISSSGPAKLSLGLRECYKYIITKVQDDKATIFVAMLQQNTIILLFWGFIKDNNWTSSSLLVMFRYCCDTFTQSEYLSSIARITSMLIKGIELDQTPDPRTNAGARINAPALF